MTHYLKLASEPFQSIIDGHKTIESRLYDTKRQSIRLGDTLVFTNRENNTQTAHARVIAIHRYDSFEAMFVRNNPTKFGKPTTPELLRQIRQFYTPEDEQKYGVIGIEFELMPS